MRAHDVYIGDVILPITPAAIQTKIKNKNEVLQLLNGDDLNLIKKPGLTEFNFEFRLPHEDYPAVKGYIPPVDILNKLQRYKKGKMPIQFIIIRNVPGLVNSINKSVTLEEYTIKEDAKEGRDLIVSVKLQLYIPLKTKKLNVKENKDGKLEATAEMERAKVNPPKEIKIAEGETYSIAAQKYIGDSSKWAEIQAINGGDPNRVPPGKVIKLV